MMEMFDKKNGAHEKVGQPVTFKDKTGCDVTVAGYGPGDAPGQWMHDVKLYKDKYAGVMTKNKDLLQKLYRYREHLIREVTGKVNAKDKKKHWTSLANIIMAKVLLQSSAVNDETEGVFCPPSLPTPRVAALSLIFPLFSLFVFVWLSDFVLVPPPPGRFAPPLTSLLPLVFPRMQSSPSVNSKQAGRGRITGSTTCRPRFGQAISAQRSRSQKLPPQRNQAQKSQTSASWWTLARAT